MTYRRSPLWRKMQGIICLYKPPCTSWKGLNLTIRQNICRELNDALPTKHVPYSCNPLVVGPWHLKENMSIYSTLIDYYTSGVAVVGIRGGWFSARALQRSRPIRVYHVKGRLGEASDEYFIDGKIRERATYHHVTKPIMDKVLSTIQSVNQRSMFDALGLNLQSQAAYEAAAGGLVKPIDTELPVFYGIKCIDFEPPNFTIEVQCINETSLYLKKLIYMIGIRLRSVAICTAVRCIRYGPFTVDHALVRHRWNLEEILKNMEMCTKIYIADAVSERHSSPKFTSPSEQSWAETEQLLVHKGIISKNELAQRRANRKLIEDSLANESCRLEAGEDSTANQKYLTN